MYHEEQMPDNLIPFAREHLKFIKTVNPFYFRMVEYRTLRDRNNSKCITTMDIDMLEGTCGCPIGWLMFMEDNPIIGDLINDDYTTHRTLEMAAYPDIPSNVDKFLFYSSWELTDETKSMDQLTSQMHEQFCKRMQIAIDKKIPAEWEFKDTF